MRVLGIDPGYAIVGFGVIDYEKGRLIPVRYGAITTNAHTLFEARLQEIYEDMCELLQVFLPDAVAMEALFYQTNKTTAMAVSEARGVLRLASQQNHIPVKEYTPMQVKQSVTGYGKATKKQVQELTRSLLHLDTIPKPDDAADALALAICHAYSARSLQYGLHTSKRRSQGYE